MVFEISAQQQARGLQRGQGFDRPAPHGREQLGSTDAVRFAGSLDQCVVRREPLRPEKAAHHREGVDASLLCQRGLVLRLAVIGQRLRRRTPGRAGARLG